ncbi:hypothetical protein [Marasmitruncus massiliensis]|uniref:hypothetical protein n=1 Tax=Marasmitruncus massiliensis TaxID=1944642 RepID=UPI0011AFD1ED|nr:hypothetical protein [Marasmitruncus massiliensis]
MADRIFIISKGVFLYFHRYSFFRTTGTSSGFYTKSNRRLHTSDGFHVDMDCYKICPLVLRIGDDVILKLFLVEQVYNILLFEVRIMTIEEREKLYNEVWSEPMTIVSKRYGISDVALRKRCIAAGIPVPPAGFWAKLRAGKEVQKIPLPALTKENKKHVSGYAIQISKDVKTLSDTELLSKDSLYIYSEKSKALIQAIRNSIIVPLQLRDPDHLIQEHKDEMNYRERQIKLNPGYQNSKYWFRKILVSFLFIWLIVFFRCSGAIISPIPLLLIK